MSTTTKPIPHDRPRPSPWLLIAAGLVLAACGAATATDTTETSDVTTTSVTDVSGDPILAFHQCLRDGGLDVPDPEPGGAIGLPVDPDDQAALAVVRGCADIHLAGGGGRVTVGGTGDNFATPAALLAFVDCMRDHGIDMPDPDPEGRIGIPDDVDPQGDAFQSAVRSCAVHLDGGIRIGSGEGGQGTLGGGG